MIRTVRQCNLSEFILTVTHMDSLSSLAGWIILNTGFSSALEAIEIVSYDTRFSISGSVRLHFVVTFMDFEQTRSLPSVGVGSPTFFLYNRTISSRRWESKSKVSCHRFQLILRSSILENSSRNKSSSVTFRTSVSLNARSRSNR